MITKFGRPRQIFALKPFSFESIEVSTLFYTDTGTQYDPIQGKKFALRD
jgi:hypothetical protein